ncbi:hypothetical protein HQ865_09240 [Mucilaginibacter mali]|uniref:Outer membrane protein beta-barrel domain-containing protein n=1 Tax=Mucilaginibacter mali TaxID=2740462 RepID=A0A7D4QEW5_9SPHI|nr:hypothetical protein [Mucilaginibacter mali]QKJ29932.1 hypothetical protein HQ865_09240 [Mucilaginibacter mali]
MSAEEKNKLDELLKKGLGTPDSFAEYNDQDWDDLEQLLDADKAPRGIIYWLPRLGSVAAILLLFLGWWMFKPAKIEVKPTVSIKPSTQLPVNNRPDSNNVNGTTPVQIAPNANNQAIAGTDVNKTAPTAPAYAHVTIKHAPLITNKAVDKRPDSHDVQPVTNNTSQQDILAKVDPKTDNKVNDQVVKPGNTDSKVNDANTTTSTNVIASAGTQQTVTDNNPANQAAPVTVKKPKVSNPSGFKPQFGLAIMASPDINGVSSFQNAKVGTNIGLLLSVGVTKKLTISTGAAYSKKPYQADFADYYAGYKFKTDPQNVYADCRVLDIPLNVDYKLYSRNRNSFSVGSGLSSYLMLKEKYTYNYASPYTTGPASFTVTNKNRHYFGVLNLNATYEHQLNTKFSIAAQPYLKVPLTDIGNARVKLQSAGVALGVRWNINNRSITP